MVAWRSEVPGLLQRAKAACERGAILLSRAFLWAEVRSSGPLCLLDRKVEAFPAQDGYLVADHEAIHAQRRPFQPVDPGRANPSISAPYDDPSLADRVVAPELGELEGTARFYGEKNASPRKEQGRYRKREGVTGAQPSDD